MNEIHDIQIRVNIEAENGDNPPYYYYRHPSGMILYIELLYHGPTDFRDRIYAIRYVFLGSNYNVLPDPECCGIIRGRRNDLSVCWTRLIEEFSPY